MIRTRKDLSFYLQEDAKCNGFSKGFFYYLLRLLIGSENAHAFRYIRALRHCEYHCNNKGIIHSFFYLFYKLKLTRLGGKYLIKVAPNVAGYGLRIIHLSGGGGVRIGAKKTGNYCGFNAGVIIGVTSSEDKRPVLGDHVVFGPSAMAFGDIMIGNNVFVAPNAVVTKDVPDNAVVGGVPAKVIKFKEQ